MALMYIEIIMQRFAEALVRPFCLSNGCTSGPRHACPPKVKLFWVLNCAQVWPILPTVYVSDVVPPINQDVLGMEALYSREGPKIVGNERLTNFITSDGHVLHSF